MAGQGAGDRLGQHLALCRDVAAGKALPGLPDEGEYQSQIAREMARAEARRNPPAEPDLLERAAA